MRAQGNVVSPASVVIPTGSDRVVRVAVVDDHAYLRNGVVEVLSRYSDIDVVASLSRADALVRHAGVQPDVVLLDFHLPEGPTAENAVAYVRALGYPVLVLTAEVDPGRLLAAVRAGASGFLGKSEDPATLHSAIRASAAGETLLSAAAASRMEADAAASPRLSFSPSLSEVLRMVAEGLDNTAIARRRSVSIGTVKKQVREIRDIYVAAGVGVPDRATLCIAARESVSGM